MPKGLLLINLGTPNQPDIPAVRRYLREFLTDKRVISLPSFLRYLLVYLFILPFRPKQSSLAYKEIWTPAGSPLLTTSIELKNTLQAQLGDDYRVALGMRYGNPSILSALKELDGCSVITVLPLYPQYASASTGSAIEEVLKHISRKTVIPSFNVISEFYNNPNYIEAQTQLINDIQEDYEHLILSYHGVPENQIIQSGCQTVCSKACPPISQANYFCYRAQCYQTSSDIANLLKLEASQYTTAFQSRLGKTPWIKPYTDEVLISLRKKGITKIAIACPSFVTDCLETLEEIAIRCKKQWIQLGGTELIVVPCLNTNPNWIKAILKII